MKRLTISATMRLTFGVLLGLSVLMGLTGWWYTSRLSAELSAMFGNNLQATVHLSNAQDALWRLRFGLGLLLVVGCPIGGILAWVVTRNLVGGLRQTVDMLRDVAEGEGDLTRRLPADARNELGDVARWFNAFVERVQRIMVDVARAASDAASAAADLSSASGLLSTGTQQQASSLEETAASLEEITGTIKQNADNARHANQLALGARDTAEKGGQVVVTAVEAMGEINQASKKIAAIITTIDEIAFQTNLLALNAAVEAARAGEQGRGFAVVASEVRNLAQRSATAAREIKALIEDSVAKVQSGSELVNKSGQTLGEIVVAVKRVTDIIAEISAASGEQSTGIDLVNKAVGQMDQVTQSAAAQTEELSTTSQSLASQAQQLRALVGKFKLRDEERARRTSSFATPPVAITPVTAPAPRKRPEPVAAAANGHGNGYGSNGHGSNGAGIDGFEEF